MATQNSSRVEKAKAEKPLQALERLLKECETGAFSLFSINALRGDGYKEEACLQRVDFEIYAQSLNDNNVFSIRSPMVPIARIVTKYKGGFFDALLVQAFTAGREDEILELKHVSAHY